MKFIPFCISCLVLTPAAFGQGTEKEPTFNIEFRMLADRGGIRELYLQPSNPSEEPDLIWVPSHKPSDWQRYSGPLPLPLFKIGETRPVPPEVAGEEGVEVPRPVASLNPAGSGKWLILLQKIRDENGELFFKSYAIKDESHELETGYLVINLSDTDFAVQMNSELHQVRAASRFHFTPQPRQDGTVDLMIGQKEDDEWKLVNTNTILMPDEGLTILFLTRNGRRVWIRRFVDKPREEEDVEED
jgi:hypothetical protein